MQASDGPPAGWEHRVLRKGDLAAFERRMLARFDDLGRGEGLEARMEGLEVLIGRRLLRVWVGVNVVTLLVSFVLALIVARLV